MELIKRFKGEDQTTLINLHVQSRDRVYGTPGNFKIMLPREFRRVLSAKLTYVNLPILYNIDSTTQVYKGGVNQALTSGGYLLDSGDISLCQHLRSVLSADSVTYSSVTGKVTIVFSVPTTLNWSTNAATRKLGTMLGFGTSDLTATTHTGSSIADVDINTMRMTIEEFGERGQVTTDARGNFTFLLPISGNTLGIKNSLISAQQLESQVIEFEPPAKIARLSVNLKDPFGDLKDLQGAEWDFGLQLIVIE